MCYDNKYPAPSASLNVHVHPKAPVPAIYFRHVNQVSDSLHIDTGGFPNIDIVLFFEKEHLGGLRDALREAANQIQDYLEVRERPMVVPEPLPPLPLWPHFPGPC